MASSSIQYSCNSSVIPNIPEEVIYGGLISYTNPSTAFIEFSIIGISCPCPTSNPQPTVRWEKKLSLFSNFHLLPTVNPELTIWELILPFADLSLAQLRKTPPGPTRSGVKIVPDIETNRIPEECKPFLDRCFLLVIYNKVLRNLTEMHTV